MRRVADVELKLASGPIPHYKEILALTKAIVQVLELEFGPKEVIKRFSDPLWFNSYACLVGFEWNYSGMTTVTLKALKEALDQIEDTSLIALGGKGKRAKITRELDNRPEIPDPLYDRFREASIKSAKVDSTYVQDGYSLYFHFILGDDKGDFTVINQKMSVQEGKVRRFHWINTQDFLNDPQVGFGISSKVLNVSSSEMKESRKAIVDMIQDLSPERIYSYIVRLRTRSETLVKYVEDEGKKIVFQELPRYLQFPKKISLKALEIAKRAESFEDFFYIKEFGPGLLRSLVYVSNIIYGTPVSWKDPVIYTYAHGTKVGRPYYVKKKLMRQEAEVLENAIKEAKVGEKRKLRALRKLQELVKIERRLAGQGDPIDLGE